MGSITFNIREKFLNNILQYEKLPTIKWIPYYHNYNHLTKTHSGILKELASNLFFSVDDALTYSNILIKYGINIIFNKAKQEKGYKIWVPIDTLDKYIMSHKISINKKLNKAVGCLLGLAIGDALGVTEEIFPSSSFKETINRVLIQRKRLKKNPQMYMLGGGPLNNNGVTLEPGDFTDDTSMALCLADSLLITKTLDTYDLMIRFVKWWDEGYNASIKGKPVGLGGNINIALQKFKKNPKQPIAGGVNPDKDAGNGAIMRMAPVALFWYNNVNMAMNMAKLQASVTHNVSEVKDGCALMAFIICCGIEGKSKNEIFDILHIINSTLENEEIIELTHKNAKWKTKNESEIITLPGRNLWSLEAALWCVYHTNNFKDALIKAINLGGDSDTIGAIVGQIAGSIYGLNSIPSMWLNTLKHKLKIEKRAIALIKRSKFTHNMII